MFLKGEEEELWRQNQAAAEPAAAEPAAAEPTASTAEPPTTSTSTAAVLTPLRPHSRFGAKLLGTGVNYLEFTANYLELESITRS